MNWAELALSALGAMWLLIAGALVAIGLLAWVLCRAMVQADEAMSEWEREL